MSSWGLWGLHTAASFTFDDKPIITRMGQHPPLEEVWKDFSDWKNQDAVNPESPEDAIQGWDNIEDYMRDRHGVSPHSSHEAAQNFFNHPVVFALAKLHTLAQDRREIHGYGNLNDDELLTGAALGLLKIRKNNHTAATDGIRLAISQARRDGWGNHAPDDDYRYSDDDVDLHMNGACWEWALAHQKLHPHLRIGQEWAWVPPDERDYPDEEWEAKHAFTHDDHWAYDVRGVFPLSEWRRWKGWDDVTFNHDPREIGGSPTWPSEDDAAHGLAARNKPRPPLPDAPQMVRGGDGVWRLARRTAMPAPSEAHDEPWPSYDRPVGGQPPNTPPAPGVWFHASPHDIPEGAHLIPSGGESVYNTRPKLNPHRTDGDFYEQSGWQGRPNWVWLENHPEFVSGWAQRDGRNHIYLVEPHDGPYPWNGTAQMGWVANGATVLKKISEDGRVPREYYDLYHDTARRHWEERNARLAMAWDQWAPQVRNDFYKHISPGGLGKLSHYCEPGGCTASRNSVSAYWIDHGQGRHSHLTFTHYPQENTIDVNLLGTHEDFQRDGVAEALIRRLHQDHPGMSINPGGMTGQGRAFHDRMIDKIPEARDVLARIAAVTGDLVDRLSDEYHQWWDRNSHALPPNPYAVRYEEEKQRGPLGYWPHIEAFLRERYPAAHQGFSYGLEDAQAALDDKDADSNRGRQDDPLKWLKGRRYESGPEAVATHGYDPSEIAAAFVLLHNQSHPNRDGMAEKDQQRLVDIFVKRQRMQRDYDRRQQTAAVTQDMVDRLHDEFHQWIKDEDIDWEDGHYEPERGPVGDWDLVEGFLADRYPAAHKGHNFGVEQVGPVLDGKEPDYDYEYFHEPDFSPYETGPEAIARHGYDPREVAASMLLLHNRSDPLRGELAQADQDRLTDIFRKRQRMQRDYERRTKIPPGTVIGRRVVARAPWNPAGGPLWRGMRVKWSPEELVRLHDLHDSGDHETLAHTILDRVQHGSTVGDWHMPREDGGGLGVFWSGSPEVSRSYSHHGDGHDPNQPGPFENVVVQAGGHDPADEWTPYDEDSPIDEEPNDFLNEDRETDLYPGAPLGITHVHVNAPAGPLSIPLTRPRRMTARLLTALDWHSHDDERQRIQLKDKIPADPTFLEPTDSTWPNPAEDWDGDEEMSEEQWWAALHHPDYDPTPRAYNYPRPPRQKTWYHVSPHEMQPGDTLIPTHRESWDNRVDGYSKYTRPGGNGFIEDEFENPLKLQPFDNSTQASNVWMSPYLHPHPRHYDEFRRNNDNLPGDMPPEERERRMRQWFSGGGHHFANWWAWRLRMPNINNGQMNIYEVRPSEHPQPWNLTYGHGWAAPSARVVRKVPREEWENPPSPEDVLRGIAEMHGPLNL